MTTKVYASKCPECGDVIYSRARHDWRSCTCGNIYIDGGFDYVRGGYKKTPPISVELEIDATKGELYADWNTGTDKFGRVCP